MNWRWDRCPRVDESSSLFLGCLMLSAGKRLENQHGIDCDSRKHGGLGRLPGRAASPGSTKHYNLRDLGLKSDAISYKWWDLKK
jgi:hypothetical protein